MCGVQFKDKIYITEVVTPELTQISHQSKREDSCVGFQKHGFGVIVDVAKLWCWIMENSTCKNNITYWVILQKDMAEYKIQVQWKKAKIQVMQGSIENLQRNKMQIQK